MKIAKFRMRRLVVVLAAVAGAIGLVVSNPDSYEQVFDEVAENAAAESEETTSAGAGTSIGGTATSDTTAGDNSSGGASSDGAGSTGS